MKFDQATIREELTAMEQRIRANPKDSSLVNRYLDYSRKLRELEYRQNGYVTPRNGVTGY